MTLLASIGSLASASGFFYSVYRLSRSRAWSAAVWGALASLCLGGLWFSVVTGMVPGFFGGTP